MIWQQQPVVLMLSLAPQAKKNMPKTANNTQKITSFNYMEKQQAEQTETKAKKKTALTIMSLRRSSPLVILLTRTATRE